MSESLEPITTAPGAALQECAYRRRRASYMAEKTNQNFITPIAPCGKARTDLVPIAEPLVIRDLINVIH